MSDCIGSGLRGGYALGTLGERLAGTKLSKTLAAGPGLVIGLDATGSYSGWTFVESGTRTVKGTFNSGAMTSLELIARVTDALPNGTVLRRLPGTDASIDNRSLAFDCRIVSERRIGLGSVDRGAFHLTTPSNGISSFEMAVS